MSRKTAITALLSFTDLVIRLKISHTVPARPGFQKALVTFVDEAVIE